MRLPAVKTILALSVAAFAASACATRPPAQTTAPAPVEQRPPVAAAPAAAPAPAVAASPVVARAPAPAAPAGPLAGSVEDFVQNVGDRVFFDTDRFDLRTEAQTALQRQAAWLQANPNVRILVAGNCDERGTREYNLALGARRATAVKEYLVSLGVDESRISTVSYGKERPIDPRPNEEGWAINRNGHTQILSGARATS
jgi:peptidoglycan-associated lipoprotein